MKEIRKEYESQFKDTERGFIHYSEWLENKLEYYTLQQEDDEPYFGWCDVEGCMDEGCSGGGAWRDTGYWTVCSFHSKMNREGKPQPKMKQSAIDKEKTRDPKTGYLPPPKKRGGCNPSK